MRIRRVIGVAQAAMVMVLAALILALVPSIAVGITRTRADRVALAALRPASSHRPVVLYGLPKPVGAGQQVVEEGVPLPQHRHSLAPNGRQWVFFEDLVPGAYFDHPGRLLFVSDDHGRVSATVATHSYPMVGGRPVFLAPGVPHRFVVFAYPAGVTGATLRRAQPAVTWVAQERAHTVLPPGALSGECVLTVGDRGPDQANFRPDLKAVTDAARGLGIPVYPLPAQKSGAAPDGTDLPGFARVLTTLDGCRDILIFIAGHGDGTRPYGVVVAGEEDARGDWHNREVRPVDLANTLRDNPTTTFKVIIDSCYSGNFLPYLDKSAAYKNLLVLSVSSSASQPSYGGDVTDVVGADGVTQPVPGAAPGAPSGFVRNIVTGWQAYADSPTAVAAAQAEGGSLFAHMIAEGQALGVVNFPAKIGATTPVTRPLNLPTSPPIPTPSPAPSPSPPPASPSNSTTSLQCPATAVLDGSEGIEDSGSVDSGDPTGIPGVIVTVTFTNPDQAVVSETVTTDGDGDYTAATPASQAGTWTSMASFAGTSEYAPSASGPCTTSVS